MRQIFRTVYAGTRSALVLSGEVSIPCDSPAVILWDSSRTMRRDGYLLRKSDREQVLCTVWFTTVPCLDEVIWLESWNSCPSWAKGISACKRLRPSVLFGQAYCQLPAWDSQERTTGNCRMDSLQDRRWYAGLCLPGRSASVKEGDQNSGQRCYYRLDGLIGATFRQRPPPSASL